MKRFRSVLAVCILVSLIVTAIPVVAIAAPAAPGESAMLSPGQQSAPQQMSGSVIIRDTGDVQAAADDFDAYAADRYIVVYTSAVTDVVATTDKLARSLGFAPTHLYTAHVRGFAARLSGQQLTALQKRAEVARVEPDRIIPAPSAYGMPTGVERVGTLANKTARVDGTDERVNVDVAVIDSGIDFSHPDLNIANWADCTSASGTGWDEIGHGTHVAGTIGALDDGFGVTGVAPGARIWSIKIFTADRSLTSWALCGVNLVADYGAAIDVANMSWGWYESGADGPCSESAIHQAICDAYNAGVTLVNAAGNEGIDTSDSVPSTFSQVIAVSALADSDGKVGGKGPSTPYGCDDCFATFSNYGADIDLAAPGVDILSTCPTYMSCDAGYGLAVHSGTSMSSPHVAGAAALYIARNGRVGPSQVRSGLIANSDPVSMAGDPDGQHERVLYVGNLNPSCTVVPTAGSPGAAAKLSCAGFRAGETVTVYWDVSGGTKIGSFTASARGGGSASFTAPTSPRGSHTIIAKGNQSRLSTKTAFRIAASMSLSPSSGPKGTTVTIRLVGYGASETVTVRMDPGTSAVKTLKTNVVTASNGTKTFTITIPTSTATGKHKIEATGSAGSKVTRTFTVTAGSSITGADVNATPSPTATPAATATSSPTATATASAPAETATSEATPTEPATPTAEPSPTETATPEPAPTETPSPEPTVEISGTPAS